MAIINGPGSKAWFNSLNIKLKRAQVLRDEEDQRDQRLAREATLL